MPEGALKGIVSRYRRRAVALFINSTQIGTRCDRQGQIRVVVKSVRHQPASLTYTRRTSIARASRLGPLTALESTRVDLRGVP